MAARIYQIDNCECDVIETMMALVTQNNDLVMSLSGSKSMVSMSMVRDYYMMMSRCLSRETREPSEA